MLIIPAGLRQSTGSVTVFAVENDEVEGEKTISISAFGGSSAPVWLRTPKKRDVTLTNNDTSRLSLELDPPGTMAEGGEATVYVRIDRPWPEGGTATIRVEPEDVFLAGFTYDATGVTTNCRYDHAGRLCTFQVPANRGGRIAAVTLQHEEDDIDGPDLTYVKLTVIHDRLHPFHLSSGEKPSLRLAIADDDVHPDVRIVLEKTSISENGGTTRFWAELSEPAPLPVRMSMVQLDTGCNFEGPCRFDISSYETIEAGQTRIGPLQSYCAAHR